MRKIRIISAILAILLAFSAVSLPVFAAVDIVDYPTFDDYTSQQLKVASMEVMYEDDNWQMYVDKQSAEFAIKNKKTGEYTFSNPYDIAINQPLPTGYTDDANTEPIRQALLSQIILTYEDVATGTIYTMKSFTDAALAGGQISFKNLDNGIRVEYAIGTVETKRLIPQWIEKSRFETQILNVLAERVNEMTGDEKQVYNAITNSQAYYRLIEAIPEDADVVYDPQSTPSPEKPETYEFMINNRGSRMYVLMGIGERAKKNIESLIRKYCPEYTYDKLEEDHEITGYEGNEKEPPLFRLAVEYTFDATGFIASIPAKSIRFNETNYRLNTLVLLPYFGCASPSISTGGAGDTDGSHARKDGYIFIPDGSGTLLSYYNEDGTLKKGTQGGSMYGYDYAIESIEANDANAETYRIPVFGLVEDYQIIKSVSRGTYKPVVGNKTVTTDYKRGFVAVIEEGDSFASIRANLQETPWAGASGSSIYNTVYALFNVKQNDSVNIGSSIGGGNSTMTATNDTKYLGNYTVRYTMLSDPEIAKSAGVKSYAPSYIGMANAYRDYLIANGALEEIAAGETESTIPLYIHSYGALDAQDTFLSIPVTVEKPLTTFEDVISMTEDLKSSNITNVNFVLEGFANGNMSKPYYPSYVKWNKTVGGAKGLEDLLAYAQENEIGIYPDFDFASAYWVKSFSGFSYRKHAARAMSGRYTTKRDYDYVFQVINKFGMGNVVSSGAYLDLFEKFAEDYDKYEIGGISVLSLGTDLNSDFNEDYAIPREDSKVNTMEVLAEMQDKYQNVVIEGGNAYALPYATDVLGIPLDNSRYQISSYSVPFIGMVLHGYINYTGGVVNTAGDVQYEVLKSLENGAALYFLLSYQNSNELKSAFAMGLNENYSVDYKTWRDDVVTYYNMLNDAIGSLQTAEITDHGFVSAYRVSEKEASFLFTQSGVTRQNLVDATAAYEKVMEEVDKLRFQSRETEANLLLYGDAKLPATDPVNLKSEVTLRNNFNIATERAKLEEAFSDKYAVDNVVSVTYTEDNGNVTEFYINYNSYDVAIEYDGGIYILGAQSFVKTKDIESKGVAAPTYEAITALQPTAGQLANYENAQENYKNAVLSGNQTQIKRAESSLNKAINAMTRTTVHVIKMVDASGSVAYFNYTTSDVLVPVSSTEFRIVASQSYVID
ncbi:MAG: hypothetical protein IJW87_06465 [Clostridia bacterium]|nr:hypothetical protein [Clostridia bacterium]